MLFTELGSRRMDMSRIEHTETEVPSRQPREDVKQTVGYAREGLAGYINL